MENFGKRQRLIKNRDTKKISRRDSCSPKYTAMMRCRFAENGYDMYQVV